MITGGISRIAGLELGYAEITASITTQANFLGEVDATGLTTTVTVGSRPILVRAMFPAIQNSTAGDRCIVFIKEGTTTLCTHGPISGAASEQVQVLLERRLAPSPGSHTYKVMFSRVSAGTATIEATATSPTFIQVIQI